MQSTLDISVKYVASVLYIMKSMLAMKQFVAPLLLASAMIGIALLAVLDIVPETLAQFAPVALLALFPSVWMGRAGCCNFAKRKAA